MLLGRLHLRRLRPLRRLADVPFTLTLLPGRVLPAPVPAPLPDAALLPDGFIPAAPAPVPPAPDVDELRVRAWLHQDQHGRTDTVTSCDTGKAQR